MEEREHQHLPDIGPGTYVVQVPKDQIYRVPPPENARIAELHRSSPKRERKGKGRCCLAIVIVLVVTAIAGGVLGGLLSIVVSPKSPRFSIQRFRVNNPVQAQYDVVLQAHNPNSKVGITYKQGGKVWVSLRRQQLASGDYPCFYQPQHNSTAFGLALRGSGSKAPLPKEVHLTLSLAIGLQARMEMGFLRSGTFTYHVTCQFTVDTLAKDTTLLSQQCHTALSP